MERIAVCEAADAAAAMVLDGYEFPAFSAESVKHSDDGLIATAEIFRRILARSKPDHYRLGVITEPVFVDIDG